MTDRHIVVVASLLLLIGVAAGAFGAHGLKRVITPDLLAVWQTAVQYQLVHGLGLLAIAALGGRYESPLPGIAAALMIAGVVLFSGSLYALALTGSRWLGAVTPFGGAAFIAAWALLALAAYRSH